ncbi:Putative protein tag-278 [Frankliniella fusca]|uniref:Uncharacterized protein n=1 Tax=Frankliniella fusca TaxID=407009 RepID=A0AAE1IV76_9NEOP|nr:Putative protein tag-278 [Frankliniella fusca]
MNVSTEQGAGQSLTEMATDSEIDLIDLPDGGEELSDEHLVVEDASDKGKSHAYAVRMQERAAEFLTFIKQECVTTQVTIDNVVKGIDNLFELYNQFLKARIFSLSDSDSVKKLDIEELFSYLSQQTIFQGVKTKYRLEKYQKSRWDAVVPRKLVFSWKRVLRHGKVSQVPDKFAYYVDFLEQLESFLQCDDVLYCVDHPKPPSEQFKSAMDGYAYQNHPIVQKYPNALGIIFYVDDISSGDTLSSYDLGLRNFLWSLANVYPELRSSVRAIHLQALCKASVAKDLKNGPIIQNFIDGINKLSSEEGVTFNIKGVPRVFHGFLLFVVGDYPALANLGGFKESAAFAYRFCRHCMITQAEKSTKFEESEVTLRTEAMHQRQLEVMAGTTVSDEEDEFEETEQHDKPSVKYGINFKSPLLQLKYFDLTKCLPEDIMHLFTEGILETECRFVLDHAVSAKGLPLNQVNFILKNFSCENVEIDRPSPIEPQHLKNGLRQTSSQILTISSLLPFIVIKHCDSETLKNFILLLKILRLCLSHVLTIDHVSLLKRMIKKYLMKFVILYPAKITAKHHFLIHLPTQIVLFSVLTEQWAMRFEAFHAILKRLSKILHNAKNLPFSLMMRMSSLQAYKIHLDKSNFLGKGAVKPTVKKSLPLAEVPHYEKVVSCLKLNEDCEAVQLSRLKWYGPTFSQGDNILVTPSSSSNNLLPQFGTVVEIFCIKERYVVLYRQLETICYSHDLNAYRFDSPKDVCFEVMEITDNCNLLQLLTVKHDGMNYAVLRRDSDPWFED